MTIATPTSAPTPLIAPDRDGLPTRGALLAIWLIYAMVTLVGLGKPIVARIQEARVLETSRQMLDAPTWDGWLRPTLNGEPRLRKPPLAYWYTAASYKLFGHVSEATGRLPTVFVGWATLALIWQFGKDLGGRRMAFFSACALASCTMFARFQRSAETDPPATLGVVIALWAICRGARPGGRLAWMYVAAVGIALAGMSKGGPAAFPIAFLILLSISERSWRPIRRFVLSGAPLLGVALVLPWFAYVFHAKTGSEQVGEEVSVLLHGANHPGFFYQYFGPLLKDVLPWVGWFLIALFAGVAMWRKRELDRAGRIALLACACVFLPLSVTRNVQAHYLLPMMPGCALVIGWWVCRVTDGTAAIDPRLAEATRWVLGVTVVVLAMAAPAVLVAGATSPRGFQAIDAIAAAVAGTAAAWLIVRHRVAPSSRQHVAFATAMLLTMPLLSGLWWPTTAGEGLRGTAAEARAKLETKLGTQPSDFLLLGGELGNVTLTFYLRQVLPLTQDEAAVRRFVAAKPNGVVIVDRASIKTKAMPPDPYLPDVLKKAHETKYAGGTLQFYVRR